jgi:hypothetical protein
MCHQSLCPFRFKAYSNSVSIHAKTNNRKVRRLEVLDVPGLTATIAVIRPAYIVLVHVDTHVPEVFEAVVHGHPLRGLALACQKRKYIVSAIPQHDERLDKLTLDPDGKFVLPGPCTLSGFGRRYDLMVVSKGCKP